MRFDLNIQRKLAIGFALGPIILAVVGWVTYDNTRELLASREPIVHSYQVIRTAIALESAFNDTENRHRGHIILFNEPALNAYRTAMRDLDSEFANLSRLTADSSSHQARLRSLRELFDSRRTVVEEAFQERSRGGLDSALAVLARIADRQIAQNIRALLDQFEEEELKVLAARNAASAKIAQNSFDTIIYGTLLSFLILGILGFFIARSIIRPVRIAVDALASTAAELLAGTTQQASGMRQQSSAVSETVTTVDEVLKTSEQAAQRASAVADSSRRAVEVSDRGREAVRDTLDAMGTVKDRTSSIAESILTLSEQAQSIGEIIASVTEIAEQTNLLALNAAIEASRAGEHGRGFTVVAAEIKTLADQSKKATLQVRQILNDIQKATNAAVMVTEDGTKSVNVALDAVEEAGRTISALAETIAEAAKTALQISASAGQQNTGMAQIHQAMAQINAAANQNLAATKQSEQAAQNLNTLGGRLKAMIS
jgi:methyl-accepting chemotaxis protein